jgi:hypothetical protein
MLVHVVDTLIAAKVAHATVSVHRLQQLLLPALCSHRVSVSHSVRAVILLLALTRCASSISPTLSTLRGS